MDCEVETIGCLHRKRCMRGFHVVGLEKASGRSTIQIFVALGPVSGYPPRLMVAGQRELGLLIHDDKFGEMLLLRQLVTEAHSVVVGAKHQGHLARRAGRLFQVDSQLVVVISNLLDLAPGLGPRLVKGADPAFDQTQVLVEGLCIFEDEAQF